jgi:hypothetical protein
MNREALERPFDRSLIKTRRGAFGQQLSYVEGVEFVRRLNEAFEGRWSFAIVNHIIRDTEVIVLGMLTTDGVSKTAFGSSSITVSRDGEVVSVGDDLKAAATDALKKCSTLLGVGLHLYGADRHADDQRPSGGTSRQRNGGKHNGSRDRSASGTSTNGNGATNGNRLTQKQLSCIWGMARSLGLSADQIRERTSKVFGVHPEHLSKIDASAFITELGEGLGQHAPGKGA